MVTNKVAATCPTCLKFRESRAPCTHAFHDLAPVPRGEHGWTDNEILELGRKMGWPFSAVEAVLVREQRIKELIGS